MKVKYILLAGGQSKRLKWDTQVPKPCLDLGSGETLLQHQIQWLHSQGVDFKDIVVTINREVNDWLRNFASQVERGNGKELSAYFGEYTTFTVEDEKLGTGGAIKKVAKDFPADIYYILNCDDLIFSESYKPSDLFEGMKEDEEWANILLAYGHYPFGVVKTFGFAGVNLVIGFEQKPLLRNMPVYAGHMAISRGALEAFPDRGDFESNTLPFLTDKRQLFATYLRGDWKTVNDAKQLDEVKKYLRGRNEE